jgi:hypothetical protein
VDEPGGREISQCHGRLLGVCASSARGHDWFGGELGRLTYIDRIAGQRGGSGGGGAARSVGWGGVGKIGRRLLGEGGV